MKVSAKWALYLSLSIFSLKGIRANAQQNTKEYLLNAVAFYNLENLFHPEKDPNKYDGDFTPNGPYGYTYEIYHKKLANLAKVLSEVATDKIADGPALYGVTEMENKQVLIDLVNQPALKDRGLKIVHFESPDARGIDVALLYNPKKFKVISAESLNVDITEDSKTEYTRDILHVIGTLQGDTMDVYVNHWPSRRGGEALSSWKREKAASVVMESVKQRRAEQPNTQIIIMGDMNDDPVNNSLLKIVGAKGDKREVASDGMFNPFYHYYKKGIGTLGYNDSWNLFDNICVSGNFVTNSNTGWKFYKAEIFKPDYLISKFGRYKGYPHRSFSGSTWIDGYSDHFPTYIYVVKNK